MPRRLISITWGELCELIEQEKDNYDRAMVVVFTSDYGDHCHTAQALTLDGEIAEREIEKSGYSHSDFALVDEDVEHNVVQSDDDESGDKLRCTQCRQGVGLKHAADCPNIADLTPPQRVLVIQ